MEGGLFPVLMSLHREIPSEILWLQPALPPEPHITLLHHTFKEWDLNCGLLVAT